MKEAEVLLSKKSTENLKLEEEINEQYTKLTEEYEW
jgi:hypothetical protein